jgi:hypothetical protein
MVNQALIKDLMYSYFNWDSKFTIDDQGVVHTQGSVIIRNAPFPNNKLPVKFGVVGGDFDIVDAGLITLENAPDQVGDTFMCAGNKLTTLMHGPSHVGRWYMASRNPLADLVGFPVDSPPLEAVLSYSDHVPLLRLLTVKQKVKVVEIKHEHEPQAEKLTAILNKHVGKGKAAAIVCAAELVRAGFKGNARW